MSKYVPELHREQAKQRYWNDPQKFRDRNRGKYEATLSSEELEMLKVKREKHAAYMRQWYAEHPGYKATADAKHRRKYIDNLRARDRWRNLQPERKAQRMAAQRRRTLLKSVEISAYGKVYYQKNKHKWRERWEQQKALPLEVRTPKYRKYGLKHRHGLTVEQYDAMLKAQNGVCAVCLEPPTTGHNKRLHVDHDHATGKVRGLLCMHCNWAISRLDNHDGWAARAEAYLKRPR